MAAGNYGLDNLCAVIDRNCLQISGDTETVMCQESVEDRWKSFGWHVIHTSGHEFDSLNQAFEEARITKGMPTVVIAHTVKGYGVSFMENKAAWHHRIPTAEEYEVACKELEIKKEASYE